MTDALSVIRGTDGTGRDISGTEGLSLLGGPEVERISLCIQIDER